MTSRRTSINIYRQIEADGLLSKRRWQVYSTLFKHGPLTGTQLSKIVRSSFGGWSLSETIRNRLTELRDAGAVAELGEVKCPINGNQVILWDVTDQLPKKIAARKQMTSKEAAKITKDFLEFVTKNSDFKSYKDIHKLRQLWKYCEDKLK